MANPAAFGSIEQTVDFLEITSDAINKKSSAVIRERVAAARDIQVKRFWTGGSSNKATSLSIGNHRHARSLLDGEITTTSRVAIGLLQQAKAIRIIQIRNGRTNGWRLIYPTTL